MSKQHPWLRRGAFWEEVVIDYNEQKPEKTVNRYRVSGGTLEDPEIEKIEKGPDDDYDHDESILTKEELIYDGLLLDIDPELFEFIMINDEPFCHVGTEVIDMMNITREAYRFIKKVRMECDRCGGSGECSDCGSDGVCSECGGDGTCTNCGGERTCVDCEGSGRCDMCEGSGRDEGDICEECGGSGLCSSCKGTNRCEECDGTGRCAYCHGSGRCGFCNGTLKCRDCGGTGLPMVQMQNWYDVATGLLLKSMATSNEQKIYTRVLVSFKLPR